MTILTIKQYGSKNFTVPMLNKIEKTGFNGPGSQSLSFKYSKTEW